MFILLIIGYCIIIHPVICIFVILLSGWCRTRMRPAHLVSYVFLYTTSTLYCTLHTSLPAKSAKTQAFFDRRFCIIFVGKIR